MKKIYLIIWGLLCLSSAIAQRHEIYNSNIASLQVMAGSDWLSMPITQLGGNAIHIDFDEMSHDYHRFSYNIEHCEADWSLSQDIYNSDYMVRTEDNPIIESVEQSLNTSQLYTHYSLTIPNEKCRLTMSGNYKLTVFDDNTGEKMFTACFMVYEPQANIGIDYVTNTDVDVNKSHQQVKVILKYNGLKVTNPSNQIKTVVLQNGRWDNAVVNAKPDYVSADGLQWLHCKPLIYDAGNVYRKFELLDLDHPTMGIDETTWDGERYHAKVITDTPRPSFVYDESAQGAFIIRNSDNDESNFTCDYAMVHFKLKTDRQPGEVYINGNWTNDQLLPAYQMSYTDDDHSYNIALPLKQGYYSYQYLVTGNNNSTYPVSTEGNFYQTLNRYDVLVYYRANGARTDKLIGWGKTSKTIQ